MEYAKDEIFSIKYNIERDKLEYSNKNKYLKTNRFIALLITLGIVFSGINFILIYNFINVLKVI